MSFDLAVWYEDAPITASAGLEKYRVFCDGYLDDGQNGRIVAFLADLASRFPGLKDDPEDSPWSVEPWVGHDHVLLNIRYPRAGEVEGVVRELAAEHELVLFNPQVATVRNPPRLTSLPGPTLTMCDGSVLKQPGGEALTAALRTLSDRNWFAILEIKDQTYVQVGLGPNAGLGGASGVYSLEHRDGSPERHRRHLATDLDDVIAAFVGLAADEPGWADRLTWEPVVF
ncbi:hypothetical protein [Actinomadura rudentiformis]|uniref:Uncharacterized protein n=1 Tax=Actinomadura rudentiformis TaxID=359158 RepID=A0A6H9YUG8_9ACTN|nr:hypothetical protein [Actinomadura rudentiformis]KAB2344300.1 hypothetical protein F8566_30585 [Actinomadura rudentiformis]